MKNLFIFFLKLGGFIGAIFYVILNVWGERDPIRIVGGIVLVTAVWRGALSIYRRMIIPAKAPLAYGKWAIVTGMLPESRVITF